MELKKLFQFLLFTGIYRALKFVNIRRNSSVFFTFLTKFSSILTKFPSILLKYLKIVNCSATNFISKDRGWLLNCWIRVSLG